jgi:hypothetical protein
MFPHLFRKIQASVTVIILVTLRQSYVINIQLTSDLTSCFCKILFLLQVLKPFGNSLLMIAAMTYAKDHADITTMASLEVLYFYESTCIQNQIEKGE